jgi:4-alpha-glucanotransferase
VEHAYAPFRALVNAVLRHAGGVRIDHIIGLFRLWWIPKGAPPTDGTYVRYDHEAMIGVLALEAHRAGAVVVGEDLGTVERGVRERLAAAGVLSYRVVWFEDDPPSRYPELAMAAITTHDLPTIAGLWSGADLAEQRALGLQPNEVAVATTRRRLARMLDSTSAGRLDDVVHDAHRRLAEAPSLLVTATLDDALMVKERPNVPGTLDERPNWSIALPVPLDALERAPLPQRIAATLARRA